MTPHAARLIALVIVSGTGAKEIDERAARDIAIASTMKAARWMQRVYFYS